MNRKANVFMYQQKVGELHETENGYEFNYEKEHLEKTDAKAVSFTLPLNSLPYVSNVLFPFFDGLIPEGWLLDIAEKNWKLNEKDRMGLLLACCKHCIGAVHIEEKK
ncbi:MAG: HipA N-terminal domain-containing protein [Chitinophagaceae bacterium]|nr:HipA N-terminal domain-containing protein [Chitinophagaceae bacterium]